MSRNYTAEMRALFDAETASGEYAVPIVAAHIVEKLRSTDPELLAGWLDANAVSFVGEALRTVEISARGHARAVAKRGVFGKAAKSGEVGGFLTLSYVVSEDNMRKQLRSMTGTDCSFVAKAYDHNAKTARFEASFFRALAKKVGADTVADHFTEQEISTMRASISGGRAA
jgi:hypothetical protein